MTRLIALAAVALCGAASAQIPQPPSGAASGAGLVTRIGLNDLKALYDAAGVAYEVLTPEGGTPYIAASPEGYRMFATPIDCPTPGQPVDCTGVALESGIWNRTVSAQDLNAINSSYLLSKAFLTAEGQPGLIYTFSIEQGVGANYIRGTLKNFLIQMKYFGTFDWLPKSAEAAPAAAAPPVGTFGVTAAGEVASERPMDSGGPRHH